MQKKKILLIIAPGKFRDEECNVPLRVFEKNNIQTTIASTEPGEYEGMLGAKIRAEKSIDDIDELDYDAVVFVGGTGADIFFDNVRAHEIAKNVYNSGKIIAAICISPVILAKAGILKGKRATVYVDKKQDLINNGVKYTEKNVEMDENIITGNGPGAAEEFANEIVARV